MTVLVLTAILACPAVAQESAKPTAKTSGSTSGEAGTRFFESKVRPILAEHCYRCHGPDSGEGKARLRVDSLESLLRGGVSGPAIVRGEPDQSLLILAVRHDGRRVDAARRRSSREAEIDALAAWVKMGAPWPALHQSSTRRLRPERRPHRMGRQARGVLGVPDPPGSDSAAGRRYALAPLADRPLHPGEARSGRAAAGAAGRQADPAAAGDARSPGHPPSPEEIDAFLRDDSAQAFERVVDRLLASPRYGERWGRHWLDVVRYADSNGMDDNLAYSDAWRYRDYVIAAFNADKPFDRFVEEQLAGDLLAEAEPARRDELLVATGFLAIGPKMLAEDDPVKQQMDIVDEQLDTTCRVFLGLTMGCARCHDHKFDPLTMSDYYGMAGIFKSTRTMLSYRVDSKWNTTALGGPRAALRLEDLEQIIDRHDNALVNGNTNRMSAEERNAHSTLLEEARKEYAAIPKAMAVAEGKVGDLEIFLRGNHLTRGPLAPRRFPTILAGADQPALSPSAERPARAGTMDDRARETRSPPG